MQFNQIGTPIAKNRQNLACKTNNLWIFLNAYKIWHMKNSPQGWLEIFSFQSFENSMQL